MQSQAHLDISPPINHASLPSISIRKHIRRIPSPSEEPTSTLVLTSSKCHFVDIRVLKFAFNPSTATAIHTTCSPETLDWAFCGTSATTALGPPTASSPATPESVAQQQECRHTVWKHFLDTASDDPENEKDEGDMYTLPDGDVLEKGFNVKEEDGTREDYEELWGDEDVRTVGRDGKRVCVAMKLDDEVESGRKGMIVRVGGWVQGILREGDGKGQSFTVERWKWVEGAAEDKSLDAAEMEGGRWERVVRLGMGEIPCGITFNPHFTEEGAFRGFEDLMEGKGDKWSVLETLQW